MDELVGKADYLTFLVVQNEAEFASLFLKQPDIACNSVNQAPQRAIIQVKCLEITLQPLYDRMDCKAEQHGAQGVTLLNAFSRLNKFVPKKEH